MDMSSTTTTGSVNILKRFKLVSILNEDAQQKMVCLHGLSSIEDGSEEKDAIVLLEKTPFSEQSIAEVLNEETSAAVILENDVYASMTLFPKPSAGGIKSTLIFPATKKHLDKFSSHEIFIVRETHEDYQNITLPFITSSMLSHLWVENILLKKTESERIVYEDPDLVNGFILLPDLKWDCKQLSNLYICALVHRRDLKSIRDLRGEHVALLESIRDKGRVAIQKKYDLNPSQLRIFFHYLPSYYHLHIHFTHVSYDSTSCTLGKAHLIDDVIDNLKLDSDYYAKASLSFVIKDSDGLWEKFKMAKNL